MRGIVRLGHACAAVGLAALLAACGPKSSPPVSCASPSLLCGTACIDINTDKNNCGGCGIACVDPSGGTATCSAGKCVPTCASPSQLCNARPGDGGAVTFACTDTSKDPVNCGACGSVCGPSQACSNGQCTNCPSGQLQCPVSGSPGQTACRAVLSDNNNCGGCGNVCGAGSRCDNGACVGLGLSTCGNADGGAAAAVDLQNDRANCGQCGNACIASEACRAGECVPCAYGMCANRCVNTQRDSQHCGTCGNACTGAQACVNGLCGAPVRVTIQPPASTGKVPQTASLQAKVDSLVPIQKVTIEGGPFGTPTDMAAQSLPSLSTTLWSSPGAFNAPTDGGTIKLTVKAYDIAYRPDAGATDVAAHSGSASTDVTALLTPTVAPSLTISNAQGAITGQSAFIPMNAGPITLTATIPATPNAASVQFTNTSVNGPLGAAALDGGVATVTLQPGELTARSSGGTTLSACVVDSVGQVSSTCQTDAGVGTLLVGKVPSVNTPALMMSDADGGTPTIVFMGGASNNQPIAVSATAVITSPGSGSPYPPTSFTATTYSTAPMVPESSSTALAVRSDQVGLDRFTCVAGNCTATQIANNQPSGLKFNTIAQITSKVILAREATTGVYLYVFPASGTNQTFTSGAFPLTQFGITSGRPSVQVMNNGAIVFVTQNAASGATSFQVKLAHPNVGIVNVGPAFAAALNDLVVYPTGEIVVHYSDPSTTPIIRVTGAYFDGSGAPVAITPVQVSSSQTGPFGWTLVRPQILAGTGLDINGKQTVWVMDVAKRKLTGLNSTLLSTAGPAVQAIRTRQNTAGYWSVSDDELKLLWMSRDPSSDPGGVSYTLWLTDLANADVLAGTSAVYSSPYMAIGTASGFAGDLSARFLHSAAGTVNTVGGPPPTIPASQQAIIFGETFQVSQPTAMNNLTTTAGDRPGRAFFAFYQSDLTPATPVAVDRFALSIFDNAATPYMPNNAYFQESAAAGALFFVGYQDHNLYAVPLARLGGNTATSVLVAEKIRSFRIREDKARILIHRGDGTLLAGQLQAGTAPGANLKTIAGGLLSGPPPLDPVNTLEQAQFTPDGEHALYFPQLGADNDRIQVEVVSVDLTTLARTNFGVAKLHFVTGPQFCVLNNGQFIAARQPLTPEYPSIDLMFASSSQNAPAHIDLGLGQLSPDFVNDPCYLSIDGSEAGFGVKTTTGATSAVILSPNGSGNLVTNYQPYPGGGIVTLPLGRFTYPFVPSYVGPPATYSPFAGPYLNEWDILWELRAGITTWYKLWGEASLTGKTQPPRMLGHGFYSLSQPRSSARRTENNNTLLLTYDATAYDGANTYPIALPLSGRPVPTPPIP